MDHVKLLNQIRSKKNLEIAFQYAIHDRIKNDYYFDYFEIEYATEHKEKLITEIEDELKEIDNYTPRLAYAYYPPKTDLCYRRMIYIPLKDLIVRYSIVILLADLLDSELSKNCFANRRAEGDRKKISLLADFAETSWPDFCLWQKESLKKYKFRPR